MLNLTCFLGFSSTGAGTLLHCALLLDSQILVCNFKSLIWRQSCSPAGLDLGRLGEGDKDCLWHSGEGLCAALICFCPSIRKVAFVIQTVLLASSLGHLAGSLACGSAGGTKCMKLSGHRSACYFLTHSNLVHPVGQL